MSNDLFLPGTEVIARGLKWEVIEAQPMGEQARVRLRGTGRFGGFEVDVLTPFEPIEPLVHDLDPEHAGQLPNWIVYHQAFLLEQALGPDAFLVVQPGRLRIEPYQLVPLARSLRMTRPRLLLADDVGLGKTVEAGLIIAELMARRRVHRLLIVTPAGPLLDQWQTEMTERFGLRLEVADRAAMDRIRRGTELGANPFDHLPLAIASMDFLKQDRVLDELERALPYDLIVMDEAHHYSETGLNEADRSEASQRRRLAEVLARQSDALLLLSATPHDGYDRSFASLLELLDPSLVDGKGRPREDAYRPHVVRRLKKHIKVFNPKLGEYVNFPERELVPVEIGADVITPPEFVEVHRALLAFIAPALKRSLRTRQYDDALAYLALLKRSTSSVVALRNTLLAVQSRIAELATSKQEEIEARQQRRKSLKTLQRKMARFGTLTLDEEQEREALEIEELSQQLSLLDSETRRVTREAERAETTSQALAEILAKAEAALDHDLKLERLIAEVKAIRQDEPAANILIYTEYVDSLREIERRLKDAKIGPTLTIHGGVRENDDQSEKIDRRAVTDRFRRQNNLILISTDAAAEGLNLHERCHHLIHLELPWNPNRLEQRNGRIDRYGQWETPVIRYLYLCGTFEERILARLLAKYERQRARLKFVPNTLGIDVSDLPEEGLFAALAEGESTLGQPCRRFNFTEGTVDVEDADVKALLQEVDSALNRFENVAKTYKWLGDEGAAADEISQRQAKRALEIGQKVGEVDLVAFVEGAVLAEGGRIKRETEWLDVYPPSNWTHGLDELPGWNGMRLRLTTDLNRLTDDKDQPVGYLGRAHPLVRRSIEHVRHLSLGQRDGYDVRVSAAKSPDGKSALLFTFLGRMQSQAGRELERVIAVRVKKDMQAEVMTEGAQWLPKPEDGVATRGLWEREFKSWGEQAQAVAEATAKQTFDEIAADFMARHQQQIEQERRELDEWLAQRADEIIGKGQTMLPLFQGLSETNPASLKRMTEFIAQVQRTSKERGEANSVLNLFNMRATKLQSHAVIASQQITPLGQIMLCD
jgi:superfamily II DNA or RNA helicase